MSSWDLETAVPGKEITTKPPPWGTEHLCRSYQRKPRSRMCSIFVVEWPCWVFSSPRYHSPAQSTKGEFHSSDLLWSKVSQIHTWQWQAPLKDKSSSYRGKIDFLEQFRIASSERDQNGAQWCIQRRGGIAASPLIPSHIQSKSFTPSILVSSKWQYRVCIEVCTASI